ncbi:MAG: DUF2508 family protein [Clostridia bacterium]|nr:DUF2508 family protein [Clostridia bacterium]
MKVKEIITTVKTGIEKKFTKPVECEEDYLRREIRETKEQIELANLHFNDASDKDMISYYAYMIKAFEVKYNSLIRRAKEINITN